MQPCREPLCPSLVLSGYCPKHERENARVYRERGERHLYQTKRWRALRRRVLGRDPLCPCGELATVADHIVPVEDGGPMWEAENLQGLCHACHARKTRDDVAGRTFT